jgi:hypothetical protein
MYKYAFKTAEGKNCCQTNDPSNLCEHCKAAFAAGDSCAPPDPYKAPLKALAAAESDFEARWKAQRRQALADEYKRA